MIVSIEAEILAELDFNVNLVLVYDLFGIFSSLIGFKNSQHSFGVYLLNSLLYLNDFQRQNKSLIAFCICKLTCKVFKLNSFWNDGFLASTKCIGLKIVNNMFKQIHDIFSMESIKFDWVFEESAVEQVYDELDSNYREICRRNSDALITRYAKPNYEGISRVLMREIR